MNSRFRFQPAVGVVPADIKSDALDAGFPAAAFVNDSRREIVPFAKSQIHPKQYLHPILRVSAAGAGVDSHDGVIFVILPGKQNKKLKLAETLLEFFKLIFCVLFK